MLENDKKKPINRLFLKIHYNYIYNQLPYKTNNLLINIKLFSK